MTILKQHTDDGPLEWICSDTGEVFEEEPNTCGYCGVGVERPFNCCTRCGQVIVAQDLDDYYADCM